MDYIIYFVLDCIDTLAIFFLFMAVFQYPIREYLKEAGILCIALASASTFGRNVLGVEAIYDLSIHIALLIFGLRFLMKIRTHRATRMVGVGAITYFALQIIVVTISTSTGIVSDTAQLDIPSSEIARLVQLTTQGVAFTLAYVIVVFDLGVSKYVRPPHDFYVREMTAEKRNVIIVSTLTLIGLSIAFYFYIVRSEIIAAFFLATILFLIVMLFTYRRDE
jgi:hypothetical protein